jgi:hypothetical protein
MRDLKLEQELALLRSVMAEAKAVRDIVQATLSTEVVVPENERRLESLRASLPKLSSRLAQEIGLPEDTSVEQLFDKVTDLPLLVRFTDLEKSKLYDLWHRWYMGLYAVQGRLKWRKEKLDELSPVALTVKRFFLNPFLLLILIGALALLVLALI